MFPPQETEIKNAVNRPPGVVRPKARGNLAATLDPQLQPRRPVGKIGRPKGARNYEWTPETDRLLTELCNKGAASAKRTVGKTIQRARSAGSVGSDGLRKAVEYRMAKLGLSPREKRQKVDASAGKRWSAAQTAALLGALGADATIESIALRTSHSVKAVRAKIARMGYRADEIPGFAVYTVADVSDLLRVTARQIRRWKERGWLETKRRRITEKCLGQFLREHADVVPFDQLPREEQTYLLDLGFPKPEGAIFKKNVRELLDGIGRQRKPRRPGRKEDDDRAKICEDESCASADELPA